MALSDRLKHAWNAFTSTDPYEGSMGAHGQYWSMSGRPDRPRLFLSNERSLISSIYTRMAIDCAAVEIRHVRTDDQKRYLEDMDSGLNNCLTLEANIDQAAEHFRRDIVTTLFDKGVAAIVPVDTTISPKDGGGYDIKTLRCGDIVMWYPKHIRVLLYNEATGLREEITLPKTAVAIVENPLYSVMNEPNSTLQRLIRKLGLSGYRRRGVGVRQARHHHPASLRDQVGITAEAGRTAEEGHRVAAQGQPVRHRIF